MPQFKLLFESSPWFILLCLLLAFVYAFALYQKNKAWNRIEVVLLFSLRFLCALVLSILLLGPIFNQFKNYYEDPVVVLAVDNSASISLVLDSAARASVQQKIALARQQFEAAGYTVEIRTLDNAPVLGDVVKFNNQGTDLSTLIRGIENDYENRNLGQIVLLSDGIYNQGISPEFFNTTTRISTVALGDNTPKNDLSISKLSYNSVSYEGNKFPLLVEVENNGYNGQEVLVSVKNGAQLVEEQRYQIKKNESIETVRFILDASQSGLQHYQVQITTNPDEFNTQNNKADAYVEVVEGKERILLLAASPHPDLKAIKSAVETNKNYELDVFIPGIYREPSEEMYDLVIFHQFPASGNLLMPWFNQYKREGIPYWIITTPKSNYNLLNSKIDFASIRLLSRDADAISACFNTSFNAFTLSDDLKTLLADVPPVYVPFSKINTNAPVFLYQQLGAVVTQNPLFIFSEIDNTRTALLLTDGLWKWKLYEYSHHERNTAFNELITKTVQYLSTRKDKRKFRCYPAKKEYDPLKPVVFETEVYNELYELVYNKNIDLTIRDTNGQEQQFSYVTSPGNTQYSISGLKEGIYKYRASTQLNNKEETVQGEFLVKKLNREALNLTANFDLLEAVASKSGGEFYTIDEFNQLNEALIKNKAPQIIHSSEFFLPVIAAEWVFFLILILISMEWFYRKYSGHY